MTKALQPEKRQDMNIAEAIEQFEHDLPGWWWSVGRCYVSADASCGPQRTGVDGDLLVDHKFDNGFHADLLPPATVVDALMNVREQAMAARAAVRGTEEQ